MMYSSQCHEGKNISIIHFITWKVNYAHQYVMVKGWIYMYSCSNLYWFIIIIFLILVVFDMCSSLVGDKGRKNILNLETRTRDKIIICYKLIRVSMWYFLLYAIKNWNTAYF